ncbi:EAL domain-containing protein [Aeromonas veronii]|uniref:EAL domain-containing protein n=1 Tax=Aeromonas veronii TaxID=654 RepID=UPI0027152AC4|nr:EAL domain-containing protein [Aeromonas veronii]WLD19796.1 EAL domain-containing protein [Aeromonas veronii]
MLLQTLHHYTGHPRLASSPKSAVAFYQPIIDQQQQVRGYEVLARQWDPVARCYQGIEFNRLGEHEMLNIDIAMLKAVVADLPALAKIGGGMLSINLNPVMPCGTYQQLLLWILLKSRKLGIAIWFEVLESALLDQEQRELINVLRCHGAHIACDDFGTRDCNFQRLMAMPYDIVKLDRSLLSQASKEHHALNMLTGLVKYLQQFSIRVVCEGVETERHIEIVNQIGCDYWQGYAYAMPAPLSRWV